MSLINSRVVFVINQFYQFVQYTPHVYKRRLYSKNGFFFFNKICLRFSITSTEYVILFSYQAQLTIRIRTNKTNTAETIISII